MIITTIVAELLYRPRAYPAAQDPADAPPLLAHSLAVKQVPLRLVLPPDELEQKHQINLGCEFSLTFIQIY